ncbi:MAG TPA: heme-binding protein [Anaeromyxobacter sp.]|nr:heme-binding protein [Anaeromyxobacter sp.]
MRSTEELGEREAKLALDAIREELVRRGKVAVIAVADSHGELISLLRMDGAPIPSVEVATKKCWTAAREWKTTGELGRAFRDAGWQMLNSDLRYTGWDGGVPVRHGGAVVGAVAVSGLDQTEDVELARLGVARIGELVGE